MLVTGHKDGEAASTSSATTTTTNEDLVKESVACSFSLLDDVQGTPPSERYGHSAVEYQGKMYIFGGCDNQGSFSSEMHIYDIGKQSPPTI